MLRGKLFIGSRYRQEFSSIIIVAEGDPVLNVIFDIETPLNTKWIALKAYGYGIIKDATSYGGGRLLTTVENVIIVD